MAPLEENQLLRVPPAPILSLRMQELGVLICDMSGYRLRRRRRRSAMTANGLTTLSSVFGPKDTADRLENEIKARGMTVFARIDHAAGAAAADMTLRPTEVLIFGNARGGTPLMQAQQAIGIDLPLKALVYQDAEGKTWLAYNDPAWLVQRHGIDAAVAANISAMTAALEAVAAKATAKE
jgi:uncharacterized protein (DUF302 family)